MSAAGFVSVRTEGGLLPVDLLRRVSLMDPGLGGLRGEDYGLAPGERLADAIVRSWNRLLPIWERFATRLERLPAGETSADSQTRDAWSKWLLDELGFARLEASRPVVIDEKPYPVSHRFGGVALHLVGARTDLEHRPQKGGRAPHSMVQEFLNRDDDYLWAIVTNGLRMRVLRDSSALTRQAFCEFDIEAIFAGQLYADFALCWLVCHATRFAGEPRSSCWLQQWSDTAKGEGVRALDDLRGGVEKAIEALGSGLLTPTNHDLRQRLESGELAADEFKAQLLRLVYRLLFLLVAEARELLADDDASPEAMARYRQSYSMERLVELARRQRGSLHHDLWAGLQVTFAALAGPGARSLGLVGLGSFLWSPTSIPDVVGAVIPNRALLDAVDHLTSFESGGVRRRVDYKNLGAEELGGVYESLLENHLEIDREGQRVTLGTAAGNERKTTGSYYTPTSLIKVLLDSALDPVLDEAEQAADPEAALLALKVLDPAVGSGHFLIAAANRIAHRLASVRSGETEPSPTELRHALREVIGRCLYGIDVNPMSVELCKVSLWMEATERGKPLSFLDHRIVCGNSLLGATPALIDAGIPDDAFKALTGDEKPVVAALKKRNKAERNGQQGFGFGSGTAGDAESLASGLAAIDRLPEDTAAQVTEKEDRLAGLHESVAAERLRVTADAWCSAFVNRKVTGAPQITTDTIRRCREDLGALTADERACIDELQEQYRFFHLHVAFPDVFRVPSDANEIENELCGWAGGFDVVLGNPPWDQIQYDPRETFALSHPSIANAQTMAKRNKMIAALASDEPEVYRKYESDVRHLDGVKQFAHACGRYPFGSVGRLNTAPLFLELMWNSVSVAGRAGTVMPTGIATDLFTQEFFRSLIENQALVSLFDFENRLRIFPGIDSRIKFCLLTLTGNARPASAAEFVFFAHTVDDLDDDARRFAMTPEDFALLNPNTKTCPVFRSTRDAAITKGIYRRVPVLLKEGDPDGDPWGFSGQLMFMMNTDSGLFRTRDELERDGWTLRGNVFFRDSQRCLPLYEGKMIHHYDHRWATYEGLESRTALVSEKMDPTFTAQPRYWVNAPDVDARCSPERGVLGGWREVCRSTDERTWISALLPRCAVGNKFPLAMTSKPLALLVASASSFASDYVARQKVGGTAMSYFIAKQLPVAVPPVLGEVLVGEIVSELSYTAWDFVSLDQAAPFRWDVDRRADLKSEIDAAVFHLYGIERDGVDYIMETFPIVKRKDEAEFGEYRTKRLILERYDAMAAAEAAGVEYQTALDPPPADPSLCHPESTRPDWARVD